MQAEVDCVAVTDHNSGAWIDGLKRAYERMRANPPAGFRELYLFPGVELSVNGGFHLLALFDPSRSTADIDTLLGRVDYVGTRGDSDGVTRKSAIEVVSAVLDSGGLPIPAHADKDKGLLELADGGRASSKLDANTVRQLCDSKQLLAVEVIDTCVAKPAVYSESRCNWTEVIGSDCHTFQGPNVPGSRFTWVKMSRPPSLEGLRLALLDGARFSVRRSDEPNGFDPLARPEHFIEEISVANARYMGRGQPLVLALSPWFNAIVGGRGTGKSTVVHALRLAYRRDEEVEKLENESARVFKAFKKVPKDRSDTGGLSATTEIVVAVSREGVPHRLRWRQDGAGAVVDERRDDAWIPAASQSITTERFPIRIFSQGQIAALAGESHDALLGLIDEVASTRAAKDSLAESTQRFLSTHAQIREIEVKLKGRDDTAVKLEDVTRKLAGFEGKQHAEILKTYQRRSRQQRELERQLETARTLSERIDALAKLVVAEDPPSGVFETEDPADQNALEFIAQLRTAIDEAASELRSAGATLRASEAQARSDLGASTWRAARADADAKYAALATELQTQGVTDPSEYGKLVQERQRLETELQRFDSLRQERDRLAGDAAAHLERTREARRALSVARRAFLEANLATNKYVRIALVPYGRHARVIEAELRDALGAKDDRFVDDILAWDEDEPKHGLVADLLRDLPQDESRAEAIELRLDAWGQRFEEAAAGRPAFGGHFNNYLQRECSKRPELLDRLRVFAPEDALQVEYSPKGDGQNFRSINQASAGQRAAAMLAFLLAHGREPIVLDQPEDDLDNHLIYELVVTQIRENKVRRQLIVVTHNPNIVVNGDAEMLHALDFRAGQCRVIQSGSLQEKPMREEVCRVMEGGHEAFEGRYKRLGGRADV
jgi:energy-coupling factor transporter ATP-binding protein EcfA2